MQRKRKPRTPTQKLFMFFVAICAIYGGYYWGSQHAPKKNVYQAIQLLQTPQTLSTFELTDQFQQPFTTVNFSNHLNLLFFGYTEDAQATQGLLTLGTRILNRLADQPALQKKTRIIFITLDPDHDSPEILKPFAAHYSREIIALTGDERQITRLARQLGVTHKKKRGKNGEYRIDHSTSIALISPQGELIGLFTGVVDTGSIANDIKQIAERYIQ